MLTANAVTSTVKGKKSWIDMMVDAANKFFDEFVKLLRSNSTVNKLFTKIGVSKAAELASKAASRHNTRDSYHSYICVTRCYHEQMFR